MSLGVIEPITEAERVNRERIAAAEAQARQILADAERRGAVLLEKRKAEAAERGKQLLHQAEQRAEVRAAEIARNARADAEAQGRLAGQSMEAAADWIIERIVKR